ncbi:MAG TPA: NAD(P)-binding domain-containing protein [Trebonia sp.]
MATIGIIGSGHVGSNLARTAIAHGYAVVIANARGPASLAGLARELGPAARAATPAEAAAAGEFAIIAIPLSGARQLPADALPGKVVIVTTNYFPQRDGPVANLDNGTATVPGIFQTLLPASKVARAFSMVDAADMSGDGHPNGDPKRRALAFAADDPVARELVIRIYEEFGFDAVDLGGLGESWRVDPGQPAFVVRQNTAELTANAAKAIRRS